MPVRSQSGSSYLECEVCNRTVPISTADFHNCEGKSRLLEQIKKLRKEAQEKASYDIPYIDENIQVKLSENRLHTPSKRKAQEIKSIPKKQDCHQEPVGEYEWDDSSPSKPPIIHEMLVKVDHVNNKAENNKNNNSDSIVESSANGNADSTCILTTSVPVSTKDNSVIDTQTVRDSNSSELIHTSVENTADTKQTGDGNYINDKSHVNNHHNQSAIGDSTDSTVVINPKSDTSTHTDINYELQSSSSMIDSTATPLPHTRHNNTDDKDDITSSTVSDNKDKAQIQLQCDSTNSLKDITLNQINLTDSNIITDKDQSISEKQEKRPKPKKEFNIRDLFNSKTNNNKESNSDTTNYSEALNGFRNLFKQVEKKEKTCEISDLEESDINKTKQENDIRSEGYTQNFGQIHPILPKSHGDFVNKMSPSLDELKVKYRYEEIMAKWKKDTKSVGGPEDVPQSDGQDNISITKTTPSDNNNDDRSGLEDHNGNQLNPEVNIDDINNINNINHSGPSKVIDSDDTERDDCDDCDDI